MNKDVKTYFEVLRQRVPREHLNKYKMVAFDLDGTLLNRNHQLSFRTISSVRMISELGVIVLLATGRMTSAIRNHLEKLGTSQLVVSHNGAMVENIETGKIYHHETVSKQVNIKILEILERKSTIIHFNFADDIYLVNPNPYSDSYSQELEVSLTYTNSLKELNKNPTSILLMDSKEVLQILLKKVQDQCKGQFDFVMAPWQNNVWRLQFLASNTSKGKGVLQVANYLGIMPDEIISFGDNYNDIDMLQNTGIGIAMENAVSELKKISDFVTFSNQNDGVALALEALYKWNI